jgi:hypothetical protein
VKVAIHDVGLDPNSTVPRGTSLSATVQSVHTLIRSYLREMGIDNALYTAAIGTPFESIRPLQREEMVRFGIDSRTFGETAWQVLSKPAPQIRKLFFARTDSDTPGYIDGAVAVDCSLGLGMPLRFIRPHITGEEDSAGDSPVAHTVIIVNGKEFRLYRASSINYYIRSTQVPSDTLGSAGDEGTIEIPGTEVDRKDALKLTMDGFSAAYAQFRKACVTSVGSALVQTKPTMLGLPTVASNTPAAASKIATTTELVRVATPDHKLQLDFFYLVQVDCSSVGRTSVKIIEQPQHGKLSIETGKASTDFPAGDQRRACNDRQSDGTFAFYEPNSDYHGADSVTLSIAPPLGAARTQHYSIQVK